MLEDSSEEESLEEEEKRGDNDEEEKNTLGSLANASLGSFSGDLSDANELRLCDIDNPGEENENLLHRAWHLR